MPGRLLEVVGHAEQGFFLEVAPQAGVRPQTTTYPLEQANQALDDLRAGRLTGAAVLVPPDDAP